MLLVGVVAIAALMSAIGFAASQYDPAPQGKGLQFVIPSGASAMVDLPAIDSAIEIPTTIVFKADEPAILSITNQDAVANRAGPWVIGPGQTYTAKFDKPGTYEYVCSVKASESVTIIVEGDES
jgi:hypothetical protein